MRIRCLAQGHKAVLLVSLEIATLQPRLGLPLNHLVLFISFKFQEVLELHNPLAADILWFVKISEFKTVFRHLGWFVYLYPIQQLWSCCDDQFT